MTNYWRVVWLSLFCSGCTVSGSYSYRAGYGSSIHSGNFGNSPKNALRPAYPSSASEGENVEDGQPSINNGLTADQQRALTNLAVVTVTTLASNSLVESDSIVDNAAGVGLRLVRASFISDTIKQAFPRLTDFENRTATRVAGLILNGQLTPENLAEQTVRGEILVQLGKEGEPMKQEAQVANFLYLLYKARN